MVHMRVFKRSKPLPGWLALSRQAGRLCLAHVAREATGDRPVVEHISSHENALASPGALEKIARELQLNRYACSHLLDAGEYQLLNVEAPNVPADELKMAIRWRLKDLLDFHVDDATIDVLDIPVDKTAASRSHSMYAVAARNQLIQQRQALFEAAKIPLSVIDIPEMAQRNVATLLEPEGRAVALLSFGAAGGLLTVSYRGELYLSRRIDVTDSQLAGSDPEQHSAVLERATLEVQRSLDHFERQFHVIALAKLVLAPLAAGSEALREHLGANLYVPVESLDLGTILDISKHPPLQQAELQQRYFLAIGAALRHEEKVL